MLGPAFSNRDEEIPVVKTIASRQEGLKELKEKIDLVLERRSTPEKRLYLLAERAYYLIQKKRMKDIRKEGLRSEIEEIFNKSHFNLYSFVQQYQK